MTSRDKGRYEGDWLNDQRHGNGRQEFPSGDVYDGDWIKDAREGKGVCKFANGDVYEGAWAGDRVRLCVVIFFRQQLL
jgi:hypothetical protein